MLVPLLASDETTESQSRWQEPSELLPSWSASSTTGVYAQKRPINIIALQLMIHHARGSWDEVNGAFETLSELQAVLNESSCTTLQVSMGDFIFTVLSHAIQHDSSTLMVHIASWQILWLVADRWPRFGNHAILSNAADWCRSLLRDRSTERIPESFAFQQKIDGHVLIYPVEGDGILLIKGTTLRWVALEQIHLHTERATLSPPDGMAGSPIVLPLDTQEAIWCFKHLYRR